MNNKSIYYIQRLSAAFLILFFSCFFATLVIEQDLFFQRFILSSVHSILEKGLGVPIHIQFHEIRLWQGVASLSNLSAQAPDGSWKWHIKKLELHFSLLKLLFQKKLIIQSVMRGLHIESETNGKAIAIAPQLVKLFSSTDAASAIVITRAIITDGSCKLFHPHGTIAAAFLADMPLLGRFRHTRIWWQNGILKAKEFPFLRTISGWYRYDHEQRKTIAFVQAESPQLPAEHRKITIEIAGESGEWSMRAKNDTDSLHCKTVIHSQQDQLEGECTFSLPMILHAYFPKCIAPDQMICTTRYTAQPSQLQESLLLNCTMTSGMWKEFSLPAIQISAKNLFTKPALQFLIEGKEKGALQGNCCIEDELCALNCTVAKDIPLGTTYSIATESCAQAFCKNWNFSHATFQLCAKQEEKKLPACTGTIQQYGPKTGTRGIIGPYHYSLNSEEGTTTFLIQEGESSLLEGIVNDARLQGSVDYKLLSQALQFFNASVPMGEGTINYQASMEANKLRCDIQLKDGALRLPHMYNMLEEGSLEAYFHWPSLTFSLKNIHAKLHKGTVAISSLSGGCNTEGSLLWLFFPYLFQNCLLSYGKDFFALFSGEGFYSYSVHNAGLIQGTLFLERGHVRNNLLSSIKPSVKAQGQSPETKKSRTELDINIISNKPLQVKTSFLDARAHMRLKAGGSLDAPMFDGNIQVIEGALLFPYKPLFIRKNNITISSQQGDEPIIDIIAENSMKGYQLKMYAYGSLKDPHITFESIPTLEQEQIIGLLCGGSIDGSLYLVMSTFIMQSLEHLIFGPSEGASPLLQSLKNLFRPLGNVRFVPSFTDQSGRGGLRGSLAIEVNDRLRGIIKQNFDLPQDTMLEVEYAISDEARIRAIKDERGDLGAEIEGSWKF